MQLPNAAECLTHRPDRYVVRPAGVLAEILGVPKLGRTG
jgi:hypothetical protein